MSLANLFCCFLSMALIMVPKIIFIRKHAHDPREKEDDEKEEKEQELKYREVIRENETLQKSIAEVMNKMQRPVYSKSAKENGNLLSEVLMRISIRPY